MRQRCVCCLAALVIAPLALVLAAETSPGPQSAEWPQWRGLNRDGISPETGLLKEWPQDGPKLLWDSRTVNGKRGVGRGYSSVSVAGGKVYTMGDRGKDGYVFALDAASGKEVWATRISPGQGDGPRCTPTVDGDRVYALSRQGILVCLSTTDGSLRWSKDYKKDFDGRMMSGWDYSESPLVDGDKLICTPGGNEAALVALDKKTGDLVWKAPIEQKGNGGNVGSGYASIVVTEACGIRQYITLLGRDKGVVGVAARDGKFLWNYNRMANGTANIPTPLVRDDLVFVSTGYGAGSALLRLVPSGDGVRAEEVYFLPGGKLQNHHGGLILLGDYIYGGHGHNNGLPFCLEWKTGKLKWGPVRGAGDESAAVAYADGHLYFRYQNGTMALVEASPQRYVLKSQFDLPKYAGQPSWPHPVIAEGKLYLRGQDTVLCYDVKQR
jgi:outer membrane protein assembly factor BamB